MIRSNLYDWSDTYMLVSGTITITGAGANDAAKRTDERNKGVIFKICAPFNDCISEKIILKYIMQKMYMLRCQCIN